MRLYSGEPLRRGSRGGTQIPGQFGPGSAANREDGWPCLGSSAPGPSQRCCEAVLVAAFQVHLGGPGCTAPCSLVACSVVGWIAFGASTGDVGQLPFGVIHAGEPCRDLKKKKNRETPEVANTRNSNFRPGLSTGISGFQG